MDTFEEDEAEDDDLEEDATDEYETGEEENDDRDNRNMSMAYERSSIGMEIHRHRMRQERLDLALEKKANRDIDKGKRVEGVAENFLALLQHRHQTTVGGWRQAIDPHSSHRVGKHEFFKAARDLGCIDDCKAIWTELVGSRDLITLADVDSESAQILAEFHRTFLNKIGARTNMLVEKTDGLRIDGKDFAEKCKKLKADVDLKLVFKALRCDIPFVTTADFDWLESYIQRGQKVAPGKSDEDKAKEEEKEEALANAAQKQALKEFRQLCQHKHGGVVAAWRKVIDPGCRGRLPIEDLRSGAAKLGFDGHFEDLWDAVVGEDAYVVTIEQLEPAAAAALESFKKSCIVRFGSVTRAFEELAAKDKPLVTRDEFISWCKEIRFDKGSDKLLWRYLDDGSVGKITVDAIDRDAAKKAFSKEARQIATQLADQLERLPSKPLHLTLVDREERKHQERLVERGAEAKNEHEELLGMFNRKFGSTVRAWRIGLDIKGAGKLSKDEFVLGCSVLGFRGDLGAIWSDLGLKDTSHIKLKDLDPSTGADIKLFRERCVARFGTVHDALQKVSKWNAKANPRVSEKEFKQLCKMMNIETPSEKMWAHLDPTKRGIVSSKSLNWLTSIPDTDERALARHLSKQVEQHREKRMIDHREKAAPTLEGVLDQKRKSNRTREVRDKQKQLADARVKLLKRMSVDFKGIGRGWCIAFDPERYGEIALDDFLTGLERLGMLKYDADEEEVAKAEELFKVFDPKGTHVVTLDRFDGGRTSDSLADLRHHLVERYGSLLSAFEIQVEANLENQPKEKDDDEEEEEDKSSIDEEGLTLISSAAFKIMCQEAKFTSAIHRLLCFLDPHSSGKIDLTFLDEEVARTAVDNVVAQKKLREAKLKRKQRRQPHLCREEPYVGVLCGVEARDHDREVRTGARALKEFKKRCTAKYVSLQGAWKKLISPAGKECVKFDSFAAACSSLQLEEEAAAAAWEALGLKGTTLSLRQLDPSIDKDVVEFHKRIIERFGTIDNAIDETDVDDSYDMSYDGFIKFCFQCQYRRNERKLFEYFGGEYKVDGSKVSFTSIDEKAVLRVKEKRIKDEERKKSEEGADRLRHEIIARRRRGLSDEPTKEEKAAILNSESQTERHHTTAGNDKQRQGPQRAGEDPSVLFRAFLLRRFGTIRRAWRTIDVFQQVALTRSEFEANLRPIGYGGSAKLVWNALKCKDLISFKDLDPEGWKLIARFRRAVVKHHGYLQAAFEDGESGTKSLDYEAFCNLCGDAQCPRPWEKLFDILDVKCAGIVRWEDVKFLDEHVDWRKDRLLRRCAMPLGIPRDSDGLPPRTGGIGHLGLCMKPRKVTLLKTNSLPTISPGLRQNWNERHAIEEILSNKTDNLIHYMSYVKVEEKIRIEQRVAKKIRQVPTSEWLKENMPVQIEDDYDDGWQR